MFKLLIDNPLLLLFVVAAIGYPIGRIKIAGSSLGVAAVLFAGLAVGSLNPNLKLPEIVYQFGLALFVYTIGLSSGRAFFASFKRGGVRDNLLVVAMLLGAFVGVIGISRWLHLKATLAAGLFAGSLTNTPALASILEYLKVSMPAKGLEQLLAEPVVGYSVAYPMGVISMLLAIAITQRLWKIDYAGEARAFNAVGSVSQQLQSQTIRITTPEASAARVRDMVADHRWDVAFSRIAHDGSLGVVTSDTKLAVGDLVSVVGEPEAVAAVARDLGEPVDDALEMDRTEVDFRRIIISNPKVAGHRLGELKLPRKYGAVVTRIRRGDVEFLPQPGTILELGDRVRVVAKREKMEAVSSYLGDSYRSLSEIDIMTFSLGLAAGLLLGAIRIPLPGTLPIQLGMAGGPLIVALILGALERTGPFLWNLPYNANLTLRQIGLILFLAGVGTRAGYAFLSTFTHGGGLAIFIAGACITTLVAITMLAIGHYVFKVPMGILTGMLAGLQTQPAVLGFALEQSGNELPNIGYAEVYPVATITKIILAQLLLSILLR